jgi:uncharacterized protein YabE (DUF348 family)
MSSLYLHYLKRALPIKQVVLLLFTAAIAVTAGYVSYGKLSKDVEVHDNGKPTVIRTMGVDVEQALGQMGITVNEHDYISTAMNAPLSPDQPNVVQIKRAVPLNIMVDGEVKEVMSYRDTVGEVVEENGIKLGPLDRYEGCGAEDPVESGMKVQLVRVREEIITEEEQIPFEISQQPNKTMNEGDSRVVVEGENGIREKHYKIVYEDGRPVSRNFVSEAITKDPVDRVIEYGTVPNFKNSRGDLIRYSKVLDMRATAYTNSFEDCGKNPGDPGYGITYTGMTARVGIVAVDPKVIPLYTKLYIEIPGSAPDYGFAIAGDIGGAIKGDLIDLFLNTSEEVARWGVRRVKVYILNEQDDSRWKENTVPFR